MNTDMTGQTGERRREDGMSRIRLQGLVLVSATAICLYICYRMALPFLPALTWALALAVLFSHLQQWLEEKLKRPNLAASATILVVGLIVAVGLAFVGQRLIVEAAKGAVIIKEKVVSGEWQRALEAQPRLATIVDWLEEKIDLQGTFDFLANGLTAAAGSIVTASVVQIVSLCLTFYLLFFFLRDRRAALQALRHLSPLLPDEMDLMIARVANTIYATIYGTLAVAAAQGLLGGLMFWWLGLSTPLFWGVVMTILALIPLLGTVPIWGIAALYLALEGSWVKALVLALWGGLVVGGIDNVLRPILVGRRLQLHTILTFLSVVGGLMLFGSSGLILGPVTLTITMVLLEIWHHRAGERRMSVILPGSPSPEDKA